MSATAPSPSPSPSPSSPPSFLPPPGQEVADSSYLLQWQNFSATLASNLAETFLSAKERQLYSDVTLVAPAGDCASTSASTSAASASAAMTSFGAHRLVLSAGSPFFRQLLSAVPSLHRDRHPVVVLKEISAVNLDSLLQFLYLGRVSVEQTRLESFLQAAEALRIRGLVNEGQNVRKRSTPGSSLGQEAKRRRQPPEEPKSSAAPFLNSRSQPEEPSTSRPEEDRGRSLEEPEEIILKCEPEDVVVFDHQQGQEGDGAGSHEEQITDGATSAAAGAPIAEPEPPQQPEAASTPPPPDPPVVLYSEKGRCHFCRALCRNRDALRVHLEAVHQPPRHALCENCENFFHICAINRHKSKCPERYTRRHEDEEEDLETQYRAAAVEAEKRSEGQRYYDDRRDGGGKQS